MFYHCDRPISSSISDCFFLRSSSYMFFSRLFLRTHFLILQIKYMFICKREYGGAWIPESSGTQPPNVSNSAPLEEQYMFLTTSPARLPVLRSHISNFSYYLALNYFSFQIRLSFATPAQIPLLCLKL